MLPFMYFIAYGKLGYISSARAAVRDCLGVYPHQHVTVSGNGGNSSVSVARLGLEVVQHWLRLLRGRRRGKRRLSGQRVVTTKMIEQLYEETRKCLERSDLDEGLHQFISQHETGATRPPPVTYESLPNSSTLGMGHMSR